MSFKRFLGFTILVLALAPAAASADQIRRPSFADMLNGAGEIGIPPEWAGIWQNADSIYDCKGNLLRTVAEEDTLCPAEPYDPGAQCPFTCTGSATGTDVDLTCTASCDIGGCTFNYTFHTVGTRVGDVATYTETISFNVTGPSVPCDFIPDFCEVTHGTTTRVGPAPKSCATPTEKTSWGTVKTRYR